MMLNFRKNQGVSLSFPKVLGPKLDIERHSRQLRSCYPRIHTNASAGQVSFLVKTPLSVLSALT